MAGKKKPRLTAMDRIGIETAPPYAIAREIDKPPRTVMCKIKGRVIESNKGAIGRVNNRCTHRYE